MHIRLSVRLSVCVSVVKIAEVGCGQIWKKHPGQQHVALGRSGLFLRVSQIILLPCVQ